MKFTKKELEYVAANMDLGLLDAEFERVAENLRSVNQDPDEAKDFLLSALPKAAPKVSDTKFGFRFLCSPKAMHGEDGLLTHVDVEENLLTLKDGDTKTRGTGEIVPLEAETIIFAIGDKVDENFGLPTEWSEFIKNESPRFPQDEKTYEVAGAEDIFVAGWSRKASDGLVGYARKDGINGAKAVLEYLEGLDVADSVDALLDEKLAGLNKPIVTGADALRLYDVEAAEAEKRGLDEFKFDDNESMLEAIGLLMRS